MYWRICRVAAIAAAVIGRLPNYGKNYHLFVTIALAVLRGQSNANAKKWRARQNLGRFTASKARPWRRTCRIWTTFEHKFLELTHLRQPWELSCHFVPHRNSMKQLKKQRKSPCLRGCDNCRQHNSSRALHNLLHQVCELQHHTKCKKTRTRIWASTVVSALAAHSADSIQPGHETQKEAMSRFLAGTSLRFTIFLCRGLWPSTRCPWRVGKKSNPSVVSAGKWKAQLAHDTGAVDMERC